MASRDTGGLGAVPETLTELHWQSDKQDSVRRKKCFMDKGVLAVEPVDWQLKKRFWMNCMADFCFTQSLFLPPLPMRHWRSIHPQAAPLPFMPRLLETLDAPRCHV